jgi:hypothetical protein
MRTACQADWWAVAFLTVEMGEVQALPGKIAASFEPYPWVERLVVLAECGSTVASPSQLTHAASNR